MLRPNTFKRTIDMCLLNITVVKKYWFDSFLGSSACSHTVTFGSWMGTNHLPFMIKRSDKLSTEKRHCSLTRSLARSPILWAAARYSYNTGGRGKCPKKKKKKDPSMSLQLSSLFDGCAGMWWDKWRLIGSWGHSKERREVITSLDQ